LHRSRRDYEVSLVGDVDNDLIAVTRRYLAHGAVVLAVFVGMELKASLNPL
jgi:hypothetical protein